MLEVFAAWRREKFHQEVDVAKMTVTLLGRPRRLLPRRTGRQPFRRDDFAFFSLGRSVVPNFFRPISTAAGFLWRRTSFSGNKRNEDDPSTGSSSSPISTRPRRTLTTKPSAPSGKMTALPTLTLL